MTPTTHHRAIPGRRQRAALNTALHATGADTGFFNDHGQVAPWPQDIDHWRPTSYEPITPEPGQPLF